MTGSGSSTSWLFLAALLSVHSSANSRRTRGPHYSDPSSCVVDTLNNTSPYIRAYYRSSSSSQADTLPCDRFNEIHVIKLLESSSSVAAAESHISLYIRPANLTELSDGGTLVFVLVSRRPIVWHVLPELTGNNVHFKFWVSNGSIVWTDAVSGATVHKVPVKRLDSLTSWVENTLGLITLYTEIPYTDQNVTHLVGIGLHRSTDDLCSGTFQPVSGCLAISNKGVNKRDLHVIEVVNAGNLSQPTPTIELLIRPAMVRRQRRNLMLVLRSHCSPVWVIETRGLRGTLDIVTDNTLNITQIDLQSVRVITEKLTGLGGQTLVDWTADKYGPPVSYTYIPVADKLELIVDGQDYYYYQPSTDIHAADRDQQETSAHQIPVKSTKLSHFTQGRMSLIQRANDSSHVVAPVKDDTECDSAVIFKPGIDVYLVTGIAFTAFCIGCLLTGAMWFIHTHVSKRRVKFHNDDLSAVGIALTSNRTGLNRPRVLTDTV